jgi:hypothetical protein
VTTDELQAESRKYLDTRIILVPLDSGRVAVYNNAAELCGILSRDATLHDTWWTWRAPTPVRKDRSHVTLEELGL